MKVKTSYIFLQYKPAFQLKLHMKGIFFLFLNKSESICNHFKRCSEKMCFLFQHKRRLWAH